MFRSLIFVCAVVLLSASAAEEDWQQPITDVHEAMEESAHETTNTIEDNVNKLKETVETNAQQINNTIHTNENAIEEGLKPCSNEMHCNARGTCMGTASAYLCLCQLGFSGKNCQETICDSVRDCNGRGICLGTTTELTCLCNLGYSGKHCETKA